MADSLEEIWQRCRELEERLRWRGPSFQPFPGVLKFPGVGKVTAANYGLPPDREVVAYVLQQLLDAAEHALDFEAQVQLLELMQDLEGLAGET